MPSNCAQLEDLAGKRRTVPFGVPYRMEPGERVIGQAPCDGDTPEIMDPRVSPAVSNSAAELSETIGPGLGDWIKFMAKPVAKLLGKEGCTQCEARRVITNAWSQLRERHGRLEAAKLMKELWEMSFKDEPDAVLVKLQEYLKA